MSGVKKSNNGLAPKQGTVGQKPKAQGLDKKSVEDLLKKAEEGIGEPGPNGGWKKKSIIS